MTIRGLRLSEPGRREDGCCVKIERAKAQIGLTKPLRNRTCDPSRAPYPRVGSKASETPKSAKSMVKAALPENDATVLSFCPVIQSHRRYAQRSTGRNARFMESICCRFQAEVAPFARCDLSQCALGRRSRDQRARPFALAPLLSERSQTHSAGSSARSWDNCA